MDDEAERAKCPACYKMFYLNRVFVSSGQEECCSSSCAVEMDGRFADRMLERGMEEQRRRDEQRDR